MKEHTVVVGREVCTETSFVVAGDLVSPMARALMSSIAPNIELLTTIGALLHRSCCAPFQCLLRHQLVVEGGKQRERVTRLVRPFIMTYLIDTTD